MASLSTLTRAIGAFITAFREEQLIPSDLYSWDEFDSRFLRYSMGEMFYVNKAYKDIAKFSARMKSNDHLYKFIRGIYNPVFRLTEGYVSKVYGGGIDWQELTGGSIPITDATPQTIDAIRQLWVWSNWGTRKSLYVRNGAKYGDSVLKVVDQPSRGKVSIEVLHPAKLRDYKLDNAGNVTYGRIEYYVPGEGSDPGYMYREDLERDVIRTFKDGKPHAFYADAADRPVNSWENEAGFVPLVLTKHRDVGMNSGMTAYHPALDKVNEINDAASILADAIRNAVNIVWFVPGLGDTTDLTPTKTSRDDVTILSARSEKVGTPFPMTANIDLAGAGANIDRQLSELEQDLPELALHQLRAARNQTAPGVERAFDDAIGRYKEAQGNYDDGLIRANKMGLSIGGMRRYKHFESFDLSSYAAGDEDHYIASRKIMGDDLSKQDRIAALRDADGKSTGILELILEELDIDETDRARVIAAVESDQRNAARGAFDSLFGNTGDTVDPAGDNANNG